jgi:hypothetical protein
MNRATELANLAMEARGYLVLQWVPGPEESPEVGDVIRKPVPLGAFGFVSGPLFVKSETDIADFQAHGLAMGMHGKAPVIEGARYFRVVAE